MIEEDVILTDPPRSSIFPLMYVDPITGQWVSDTTPAGKRIELAPGGLTIQDWLFGPVDLFAFRFGTQGFWIEQPGTFIAIASAGFPNPEMFIGSLGAGGRIWGQPGWPIDIFTNGADLQLYTVGALGDVDIYPVGDVILSPTGDIVIPSDQPVFMDGAIKTRSLKWDSVSGKFVMNDDLDVGGNLWNSGFFDMTGGAGFWFAPPRMTTAQRNAMIAGWGVGDAGKNWYNTTTNQWEGWNGVAVAIIG